MESVNHQKRHTESKPLLISNLDYRISQVIAEGISMRQIITYILYVKFLCVYIYVYIYIYIYIYVYTVKPHLSGKVGPKGVRKTEISVT